LSKKEKKKVVGKKSVKEEFIEDTARLLGDAEKIVKNNFSRA